MSNLAEGAVIALQERVAQLEIMVHEERAHNNVLHERVDDLTRALQELVQQNRNRGN